jgi:GR25 family glycosyltransferase involved in LPS biosynthesis
MGHLKMRDWRDDNSTSEFMSDEEELAIFEAVDKREQTRTALAKEYRCSVATISSIVAEQRFKKANKAMAKNMGAREIQCAGYLWSKGFAISRRPK